MPETNVSREGQRHRSRELRDDAVHARADAPLRRPRCGERCRHRNRARPAPCGARPERRRQDDAHQSPVRRSRRHRAAASSTRARTSRATRRIAARGSASAAAIRRPTSSRRSPRSKTAGWPHSRARRARCICSPMPPRSVRSSKPRRGALDAAGLGPRAAARRVDAVARRAAPARDRDGARHATRGAAARRAARRHGRGGGRAHGGAPAQARRRGMRSCWSSTTWMPCSPSPIRLP